MYSSTATVLLSLLAGSHALHATSGYSGYGDSAYLSAADAYFEKVCTPETSDGNLDMNAPCNANLAVLYQCSLGKTLSELDDLDPTNQTQVMPTAQQACFCQSQWFNDLLGCYACASKHGLGESQPVVSSSAVSSFSSSYCAVTNTPTKYFDEILLHALGTSVVSINTAKATTFSDPIGNKTDVSLYFTPSVTGSAAYVISPHTASATASASTTVRTSNGQIVAAAASSSSLSGLAAMPTPCLEKLVYVGAVGLAGAVAML